MPGDPRWTGPPEAIAATFEAGSPASVISNNLVWATETSHHALAAGMSGANTASTLVSWHGFGANASAAAANGLNAGLQTIAGWTAHKIAVTQGAIDAFTTARSSVIPSVVSQTNRTEREAMDKANPGALWSLTPAIIERDLEYYGEHWPQNSTVGMGYSTAMSGFTAALGIPPPLAPVGASAAAPAEAGEAVSQAAAATGGQDGISLSSQAAQAAGQAPASSASGITDQLSSFTGPLQEAASSVVQPLSGVLQAPMQGVQSLSSLPSSLMGSTSGLFSSATAQQAAEAEAVAAPLGLSGGGAAGGLGAGAAGAAGSAAGAFPGAGLTSYTRPASTFEPVTGGRPTGLRTAAFNATEVSRPTSTVGSGVTGMPMAPAAMAARGNGEGPSQEAVTHARVVVPGDRVASE
ncbi:PPE domain-containing protein [Candidatus Mycobacterium methanotrophicum]|uniref:PPE domain-containing protein n=1 Tax=Candidatus Mycobacterium methanotrophicum TaxID=2943498 RepID=A0ABY4QJB7_9MYCO|nr:PPE domain-containing protein [Candidatus Mycobacterium methanotrophicum]UQX11068.1 PPE domain-containing protein [Candidatus Mycobacterium methanotrophicum]